MSPLVLLAGLTYTLFLLGLGFRDGRFLALALPMLVYLAAAAYHTPGRVRLAARRSFSSDRAEAGAVVDVHLEVRNEGEALEEVLVRDCLPQDVVLAGGQGFKTFDSDLANPGVGSHKIIFALVKFHNHFCNRISAIGNTLQVH